jgi:23S rRNA (cytosine1962-C5)-methyltransferase
MKHNYELLDSGDSSKLERFGPYIIERPSLQALWPRKNPNWESLRDASFSREKGNNWKFYKKLPVSWEMEFAGLNLKISPTDFGHLGIFPEHYQHFEWMKAQVQPGTPFKFLNLFAYSGTASVYMAKAGCEVCHLDASKKIVDWAKENARLSSASDLPIRWIVDDAMKFLKREAKRGSFYHGILLDPPSFGRGAQGQVFKIEDEIFELLKLCQDVLAPDSSFLCLSNHTPGLTGKVLENLLIALNLKKGVIESGDMMIPSETSYALPSGTFARWSRC